MSIALRPYQQESLDAIIAPPKGVTRQLAVLATGAGKTILFGKLLSNVLQPGQRALVLAHREELLAQAKEKILAVDSQLDIELERGSERALRVLPPESQEKRGVVIASVQTMHERRLSEWAADAFSYIIVDEAHHATAESYQRILEYFGCLDGRTPLLGVTATPDRSDGVTLGSIFQRISADVGIKKLVDLGHLCRIRCRRIATGVDITRVKATMGDYAIGDLAEAVDNPVRNGLLVESYLRWGDKRKALVFCAKVDHAQHVADAFLARGITAETVHGAMGAEDRKATLARFSSGETRVLTNYNVLTEGFDEPSVGVVVLARPTRSALILTQMIGRGTRTSPGKDDLLVIDLQDVTGGKKRTASTAALAGLPDSFDADGQDVFQLADDLDRLDPRLAMRALSAEALRTLLEKQDLGEVELLIDGDDPQTRLWSKFLWATIADDKWGIKVDDVSSYRISIDALSRYVVEVHEETEVFPIGTFAKVEEAFAHADASITELFGDRLPLLRRDARWRKAPATPAQLAVLARNGMTFHTDITKGQAHVLIDEIFTKRKLKKMQRMQPRATTQNAGPVHEAG